MENYQKIIKIDGITDMDIARSIFNLSGFPEGSQLGRITNIYHKGRASENPTRDYNNKAAYGIHKEKVDKAGIDNAVFYFGPDFLVIQLYRPPENSEREWQPTNEYHIEVHDKVDKSLINRIKEEFKTTCSTK
jgi:hypothetical protein